MRFKLTLRSAAEPAVIPINYQYPLSAAIYRILEKGNDEYARFLHETGYGKGYKFFTFSDLNLRYRRVGDRFILTDPSVSVLICFHLPEASQTFIHGLFRSEKIVIADKKSKTVFNVESIVALENPIKNIPENQVVRITVRPGSALVAGGKNDRGNYEFYNPDDDRFIQSLIVNWRNKIAACWDDQTVAEAVLLMEVEKYPGPFRSRLVTIKDTDDRARTQIRGFLNFRLKLTAEQRFLDLVLNAGLGLYSAQGMGCIEVVEG